MNMVTGFFPGKLKLKGEIFKDSLVTEKAKDILKGISGIKEVETDYNTGSVVLKYSPLKVPVDKLKSLLPFLKEFQPLAENYDSSKQALVMKKLDELKEMIASW